MEPPDTTPGTTPQARHVTSRAAKGGQEDGRPLVSLVVPAYNEALIVERHLACLCQYMASLADVYRWELIIVNDGSSDETGALAEAFARTRDNVRVVHHPINAGLGQALSTGFTHCQGDYVVTLDLDLSYTPDHIQKLLSKMRATRAKIVATSPYMPGGRISNVPWLRRTLSVWANRFLSTAAKGHLSTLTGMVRAYDRTFLQTLDLRATGMDINPEIIYKAMLLNARIEEIPAHLHWQSQPSASVKRRSSMKVLRHTYAVLLAGFLFRPVLCFIIPGVVLLLLSLYANSWVLIHVFTHYQQVTEYSWFLSRLSVAVAASYGEHHHTFVLGGMTWILAMQFIGLGVLALQSKSYFEEIFHLVTTVYKDHQQSERNNT